MGGGEEEKEMYGGVEMKHTRTHTQPPCTMWLWEEWWPCVGPWQLLRPHLSPRATLRWGPGTVLLVVIYCG